MCKAIYSSQLWAFTTSITYKSIKCRYFILYPYIWYQLLYPTSIVYQLSPALFQGTHIHSNGSSVGCAGDLPQLPWPHLPQTGRLHLSRQETGTALRRGLSSGLDGVVGAEKSFKHAHCHTVSACCTEQVVYNAWLSAPMSDSLNFLNSLPYGTYSLTPLTPPPFRG